MSGYTPKYGAINSVIDNTTTYSIKDNTGTDFMFEVNPININEEQLSEILLSFGNENVWFIKAHSNIVPPKEYDIQKALEKGYIIKLSISCILIDNYGIVHQIEYDEKDNKYNVKPNNLIKMVKQMPDYFPLSDLLIDLIKESNNPRNILIGLSNYSKIVYTKTFTEIKLLQDELKSLSDRIKILEQK